MTAHALHKQHWIFDLDGTLTVAVHDFAAIRDSLGIPSGADILHFLASLPPAQSAQLHHRLHAIEVELARNARPALGALEFISHLAQQGARLAILTRNTRHNACLSLEAIGLATYFHHDWVLGRDEAIPKPDPDGIHQLLNAWQIKPDEAVMVGDYQYDLATGRAAGTHTVHVDQTGEFLWPELTDIAVSSLAELYQQRCRV